MRSIWKEGTLAVHIPSTTSASPSSLAALEAKFGKLPRDYAWFLDAHDGASLSSNELKGTKGKVGVKRFLPAIEILGQAEAIDCFPRRLLPFAEDNSGNFLGLSFDDHQVYFWDHELGGVELVAESFAQFLEGLSAYTVRLDPSQVLSAWIDPSLKPKV